MHWKPIPEYEGYYEVSDGGMIRRMISRGGVPRVSTINGSIHPNGYTYVGLSKGGIVRKFYVHSLVCKAFLGNVRVGRTSGCLQVNHKNGIKQDNRLENLEYVTTEENHAHSARTGLSAKGERNGNCKLKNTDVIAIRSSVLPAATLADKYGVHFNQIYRIKKMVLWAHLS